MNEYSIAVSTEYTIEELKDIGLYIRCKYLDVTGGYNFFTYQTKKNSYTIEDIISNLYFYNVFEEVMPNKDSALLFKKNDSFLPSIRKASYLGSGSFFYVYKADETGATKKEKFKINKFIKKNQLVESGVHLVDDITDIINRENKYKGVNYENIYLTCFYKKATPIYLTELYVKKTDDRQLYRIIQKGNIINYEVEEKRYNHLCYNKEEKKLKWINILFYDASNYKGWKPITELSYLVSVQKKEV